MTDANVTCPTNNANNGTVAGTTTTATMCNGRRTCARCGTVCATGGTTCPRCGCVTTRS